MAQYTEHVAASYLGKALTPECLERLRILYCPTDHLLRYNRVGTLQALQFIGALHKNNNSAIVKIISVDSPDVALRLYRYANSGDPSKLWELDYPISHATPEPSGSKQSPILLAESVPMDFGTPPHNANIWVSESQSILQSINTTPPHTTPSPMPSSGIAPSPPTTPRREAFADLLASPPPSPPYETLGASPALLPPPPSMPANPPPAQQQPPPLHRRSRVAQEATSFNLDNFYKHDYLGT